MLRFTTMTAAILLAGTALADQSCLKDATGLQCDVFLDEYRADEIPVGTTNFWSTQPYLLQHFGKMRPDIAGSDPAGDDVLYWDGDSAMVVPERSGPRVEIADW